MKRIAKDQADALVAQQQADLLLEAEREITKDLSKTVDDLRLLVL